LTGELKKRVPVREVVAVALGSNVGDRRAHIEFAFERLRELLTNLRTSSVFETEPVDVPNEQPHFLNAAAVGETMLTPRELLATLLAIEHARGRERPYAGAARTLDLDLVLMGERVVDEEGLAVPHPRFRERRFVLEPLAEIAPALRDPVSGRTVEELFRRLAPRAAEERRR
jgi:2-amino-4-hydroxy-6-hydroxymethyldihydropteridine diphosphokinase